MHSGILTVSLALALGTAFAQAPETPAQQPGSASPGGPAISAKTVRGCLNSANDTYTVIDQASGKTYKIAGDTTQLKQHIGQLVEISGELRTVTGPVSSESGSQTLTFGDVRELAPACPKSESKLSHQPVLIAQREEAPDANNDLNSSAPFSSNSSDTSAAARSNSTVTSKRRVSTDVSVTGHAGQHQQAINTSSTSSAGQTTPPPNTAPGGYNNNQVQGNGGAAEAMDPSARNHRPGPGTGTVAQPGGRNPSLTGNTPAEAERAAEAAGRAEMHTNSQTGKTSFSTMRSSEENGTSRANPKVQRKPKPNQSGTNNEPK